jgi:hypothetical protein
LGIRFKGGFAAKTPSTPRKAKIRDFEVLGELGVLAVKRFGLEVG